MSEIKIINLTKENIENYGMCGYKNHKNQCFQAKLSWTKEQLDSGLIYKVLYSEKDGSVGGIDYANSENTFRPVVADNFYVIHCIYIVKKAYKQKGYAKMLLEEAIADTKKNKKDGICVVTRKGTWMASKDLFIKNGFEIVDSSKPDYELLSMKLNKNANDPKFRDISKSEYLTKYNKDLVILTSNQCPYALKAVEDITKYAKEEYKLNAKIIEINSFEDIQKVPSNFGNFAIMYNGKVLIDHPISKTRFRNLMNKEIDLMNK